MTDEILFILDDRRVIAQAGETVWQVARRYGQELPHLCLSNEPDFRPDGNCRVCMVEVEGLRPLAPSCATYPIPGMRVMTNSSRARHARRLVMELLITEAAIHSKSECARWAQELGVTESRFPQSEILPVPDESHPGIGVNLAACIRCMRCIQACDEVELYDVIGMSGRGQHSRIVFDLDDPMGQSTCVSCGSCAQTCPTGALMFRRMV